MEDPIPITIPTQINDYLQSEEEVYGGRLKLFALRWREFGASDYILDWITNGVPIDSNPLKWREFHQRKFTSKEWEWLSKEIANMIRLKVIQKGSHLSVINPINTVPKKGPDLFRFILDLRMINLGIESEHFKMETLARCLKFLKKGMWACKIDLKKGYFHVPIKKEDQHLLGFIFDQQVYEFTCLAFGLNKAPKVFTKIFKEIMKNWRKRGIIAFIYIDDILVLGFSPEETITNVGIVLMDLFVLGWLVNLAKCVLIPTQIVEFLGLILNFLEGLVQIPEEKKETALQFINDLLDSRKYFPCKKIAKFLGKMEFLVLAEPYIPPFLHRLRQNMISVVQNRSWHSSMMINRGASKDLQLLKDILLRHKGVPFELEIPKATIVNSDASLEGYGIHAENKIMVGKFHSSEHINVKELLALQVFFQEAEQEKLYPHGQNFEIRGDNTTAISYVRKGYGVKDDLCAVARDLWKILRRNKWWISKVVYIPSERNVLADRLSRLGDWKSSQELIDLIEKEFGHHTIDRFASKNSAITILFNTWLENDAFQELWDQESLNYCAPPIGLIAQALVHLIKSEAKATFVVPDWPSSIWYPILLKISLKKRTVPRKMLIIEPSTELYNKFENQNFLIVQVDGKLYKK